MATSIFTDKYEKRNTKKNQKYLIFEEKQKIEQGLNDIWSIINTTEEKKAALAYTRPIFVKCQERIKEKVLGLLKAKNELLAEVGVLGEIIEKEVFTRFWPKDIGKGLMWLESKKNESELSSVSIFDIPEEDLITKRRLSVITI